jgi:sterol desaturase/sphingolipid hydroxylase (fatty acid hydroxylase superfamily)
MTVVTGARHYWLEQVTVAVVPIVSMIFRIPSEMMAPILIFYFVFGDGLVHANIRVSFGPFTMIVNNPQYHRIHHSVEPQHWNKNFCKGFPVFDVLFGTAWKPRKNEFPQTGLVPSERAAGFIDGLIWPVRKTVRRAKYRTAAAP